MVSDGLAKASTRVLLRLARQYGVEDELPRGSLEKREIIAVVREAIAAAEARASSRARASFLRRTGLVGVVVLVIVVLLRERQGWDFFAERRTLARYAIDLGAPLAAAAVALAGLLDLLSTWLRASVLASWVLTPRGMLRWCLLTAWIPSFPVSLHHASAAIDLAPVFFLWLLRVAQRRLENFIVTRMRRRHAGA